MNQTGNEAQEPVDGVLRADLDLLFQINTFKSTEKAIKPKKGDILGLNRHLLGVPYEHYGVYIGDGRVIHYTTLSSGIDLDLQIVETSFKTFLKTNEEFFILSFEHLKQPVKSGLIPIHNIKDTFCPKCDEFLKNLQEVREMLKKSEMKLYSPKETVQRAKSRLGEKKYNLLLNNCEHFAIWCKTGLSKSYQVEKVLKVLIPRLGRHS